MRALPLSYAWASFWKSAKAERRTKFSTVSLPTKIVIAYEPVWAIGTGRTATDAQAQETIAYIRKKIGELFCPKCAEKIIIQYGGSMNAGNCKGLMAQNDIDGGLIGGASLKTDFAAIVNYNK